MSEDIFDIVDENDAVISNAPRSRVHSEGLRHRASHVVIVSGAKGGRSILLQKRSAFKDSYPLRYTTSCSGHVDSGESYDDAALREMFEETGLKVCAKDLIRIGKIDACPDTGNEFTYVYLFECPDGAKFSPPPDEVESLEWVRIGDFESDAAANPQKYTPSFLRVWNYCKSHSPMRL